MHFFIFLSLLIQLCLTKKGYLKNIKYNTMILDQSNFNESVISLLSSLLLKKL